MNGGGEAGFVDGEGAAARFNLPLGIASDGEGNFVVADTLTDSIRKVIVIVIAGRPR